MARFAPSGSLAADRRYLWAEAAQAAGDHAEAVELFQQAVEVAPDWPAAFFALGRALIKTGQSDAARAALNRCLVLDAEDLLGAALLLQRLPGEAQRAMPERYVQGLFDDYAQRFDQHLTGALNYSAPQVLRQAVLASSQMLGRAARFETALDLGCGTGLMAPALAGLADALDGVDLSQRMLDRATAGGHYRALVQAEATAYLDACATRYDLMLAADVLVYIGDLAPLFAAVRLRLAPGGIFAFTAQRLSGPGYRLGHDMRFAHSADYIRAAAQGAGLRTVLLHHVSTRRDAGQDVPGLAVVLAPG